MSLIPRSLADVNDVSGEAISSGDLKAKKHGRRTIILPDDFRVWLKTLPDAREPIEESPAQAEALTFRRCCGAD
jgi:hypothetical protein